MNPIYVWDIQYGIPKSVEEARRIVAELECAPETEPSPRMAAFGKKVADEFVTPALRYFDGSRELWVANGIARHTAVMRTCIYCFKESMPEELEMVFLYAVVRAASENGLTVFRDCPLGLLFLPDGTEYYADKKSDWRQNAAEEEAVWEEMLEKARSKEGVIPSGELGRARLISRIIQERAGERLGMLFDKYDFAPKYADFFVNLQTDLLSRFVFSARLGREFDKDVFTSYIMMEFRENYREVIDFLMPKQQTSKKYAPARGVKLHEFYGVWPEENNRVRTVLINHTEWVISSYEELVSLVQASTDMLMYYLPHIGTAEDFTEFVRAHNAGETDFGRLTLAETNPAKRQLYSD